MRREISHRITAQIEYVIRGVISQSFECRDQIRTQCLYPTVARRNQPSTRRIYYTPSSIGLGQQQLVIQSCRGLKRRKSVVQGRRDAAVFQHHETHPRFAGPLILDDPAVQRMQACSALQGAQRPIQTYNVFIIFRTENYIAYSFSELICFHTVACRRGKHPARARYNFSESALSTKNPRLSPGVLHFNEMPASDRHYRIRQRPSWPRPGIPRSGRSSCSGRSPRHWR